MRSPFVYIVNVFGFGLSDTETGRGPAARAETGVVHHFHSAKINLDFHSAHLIMEDLRFHSGLLLFQSISGHIDVPVQAS